MFLPVKPQQAENRIRLRYIPAFPRSRIEEALGRRDFFAKWQLNLYIMHKKYCIKYGCTKKINYGMISDMNSSNLIAADTKEEGHE